MYKWKPPQYGEPTENHVKVWAVKVGNLPIFFVRKKIKEAIKFIQKQDGFIAFYPMYPEGTLCLFKTENYAKGARNMMRFYGIEVYGEIIEVYVNKRCVDGE